ncbi:unnamed protein product [Ambrosiozyma monospora]|uniref:Unnamed protein product n=1 Tax=Ambrosiozyma monospora TaxID=43982 RepID=A0ACB5TE12_AMBMO|nr:unnamed protein product [Ambrosiozyma monospora]
MSARKGLASFDDVTSHKQKFQNLGQKLVLQQREELKTQLQVFQNALISFKKQYNDEIIQNPEFRVEFSQICQSFGIDPLVVSSSMNGEASDEEEKINQLSLKIFDVCSVTKNLNGGIISIKDLIKLINKDTWFNEDLNLKIVEADVLKALDNLKVLGDELQIIKIGGKNYIKSVPQQLSNDQSLILSTSEMLGFVSIPMLHDNFNWKTVRCRTNLDELVANGLLWIDKKEGEREILYWSTSWINKELGNDMLKFEEALTY